MINSRGSVLLASVTALAILSMLLIGVDTANHGAGGFMQVIDSEHQWVQRDYANIAALNLAEAGLERALDDISQTWSSGSNYSKTETFNAGSYIVQTINATSSSYTLEAAGSAAIRDSIVTRKIRLTLNKEGVDTPYVILTKGNLNLKKANATLQGISSTVLHANGNFQYEGDISVYTENEFGETVLGGVNASGHINGNGTLNSSEANANMPTVALPTVNFDQLKTEASSSIDGNYEVNGGTLGSANSITYVDGNLTLEGNVTAKGTIVVDGNVDIQGTVKPPNGETLEIISKGNVDFDDQGVSSSGPELIASIYAEGNFKLRPGSPWIEGFIIATGNMEFTSANAGTLKIDYKENANSKLTTVKTSVADWQEVY